MTQEEKTHQEKVDFYNEKIRLTKERINILQHYVDNRSDNRSGSDIYNAHAIWKKTLQQNTNELEILSLLASLENLHHYWDHYTKRLKAIQEKEQLITEDCNKKFDEYLSEILAIPSEKIKSFPESFQNHYRKFCSPLAFETQEEKNDIFMLMKEFLYQYQKNLIPSI